MVIAFPAFMRSHSQIAMDETAFQYNWEARADCGFVAQRRMLDGTGS
jgi:hypothetical protein